MTPYKKYSLIDYTKMPSASFEASQTGKRDDRISQENVYIAGKIVANGKGMETSDSVILLVRKSFKTENYFLNSYISTRRSFVSFKRLCAFVLYKIWPYLYFISRTRSFHVLELVYWSRERFKR